MNTHATGDRIKLQRLAQQLGARGIKDEKVLAAMRSVPREPFVEEGLRAQAYSDASLPIGEQQTISQPWIVARMCELAGPDFGGRVLEIGTGSGYHASVLSRLFEQVYSVERIVSLSQKARGNVRALGIENVHFKIFDGGYGWSEFAPYKAVIVAAAAPEIPTPLIDQLEEGGKLIVPLADERPSAQRNQKLVRVIKRESGNVTEDHGPCRFVPLTGKFGWSR